MKERISIQEACLDHIMKVGAIVDNNLSPLGQKIRILNDEFGDMLFNYVKQIQEMKKDLSQRKAEYKLERERNEVLNNMSQGLTTEELKSYVIVDRKNLLPPA